MPVMKLGNIEPDCENCSCANCMHVHAYESPMMIYTRDVMEKAALGQSTTLPHPMTGVVIDTTPASGEPG